MRIMMLMKDDGEGGGRVRRLWVNAKGCVAVSSVLFPRLP